MNDDEASLRMSRAALSVVVGGAPALAANSPSGKWSRARWSHDCEHHLLSCISHHLFMTLSFDCYLVAFSLIAPKSSLRPQKVEVLQAAKYLLHLAFLTSQPLALINVTACSPAFTRHLS